MLVISEGVGHSSRSPEKSCAMNPDPPRDEGEPRDRDNGDGAPIGGLWSSANIPNGEKRKGERGSERGKERDERMRGTEEREQRDRKRERG